MRYICLLAILLALPGTASAQDRAGSSNRNAVRKSEAATTTNERREERQAVRANDRGNDRQNARQNDRQNGRNNNRQNDGWSGLSPLGLQPRTQPQLPWWEQRQQPYWEQPRTPFWEGRQVAPEQQLVNPSRAAQKLNADLERAQRASGGHRQRDNRPQVVYVLPPYRYFPNNSVYGYGVESTTYITPAPAPVIEAPPPPPVDVTTGFLRLEVEPRHLIQVFVDGLYIGTPADLGDEFELRLGARRIELRAPGYRTLVFDTQIVPDRTIVYRGELERVGTVTTAPAPLAPQAPQAPQSPQAPERKKMFLIPGCYMGNVEPTAAMLRPGCDLSKLITSP